MFSGSLKIIDKNELLKKVINRTQWKQINKMFKLINWATSHLSSFRAFKYGRQTLFDRMTDRPGKKGGND